MTTSHSLWLDNDYNAFGSYSVVEASRSILDLSALSSNVKTTLDLLHNVQEIRGVEMGGVEDAICPYQRKKY